MKPHHYDLISQTTFGFRATRKNRLWKAIAVFLRFLLLLAIIPLLELWLLIELTKQTSLGWTIALVLSTGMIGMSLVRWQGMQAWRKIQQQISSGQSPSESILSGVMILVAGALLLTPGMITDTAGFLLLVPPVRLACARYFQKFLVARAVSGAANSVWVSSFTSNFNQPPVAEPSDATERPGVRVIDPNEGRLPK